MLEAIRNIQVINNNCEVQHSNVDTDTFNQHIKYANGKNNWNSGENMQYVEQKYTYN